LRNLVVANGISGHRDSYRHCSNKAQFIVATVLPKHLVQMGQCLAVVAKLVAVATQCVDNMFYVIRCKNLRSSKLPNLLGGLADCQVTRSSLAMLHFAIGRESKSFFGGLVGLLFTH